MNITYIEGIDYIKSEVDKRKLNGEIEFILHPVSFIHLSFPGKLNEYDYIMSTSKTEKPSHYKICKILIELIDTKRYSFNTLNKFLSNIHTKGTTIDFDDIYLNNLKHAIFWVTLQEEINYPRSEGKAGINLPFCRYYEAIYCAEYNPIFDIQHIQYRCLNHGRIKPPLYQIKAPNYYNY